MKKIITSILAIAALVGCSQNDEVAVNGADNKVSFEIEASMPEARTALVETGGKYGAIWTTGDTFYVAEILDGASRSYYKDGLVVEDSPTLSAKVTFDAAAGKSEYKYILASPKMSMNGACTYMAFTLPTEQAPPKMNTHDPLADYLVSKAVVRTAQPAADEVIPFEIGRLSSFGKITIKNVGLAADDKIKAVKFISAQPIAGKITSVMVEDVTAGVYPLPYTVSNAEYAVNVTLPEPQTGDFTYFMSCWPATLAVGETYSVVVTTEKTTFTKQATIPAELKFVAGDITSFTVNMAGVPDDNATDPEPEPEPDQPAYITVAGIKWAAGNLHYEVGGTASEGFAEGWSIAPNQAHHFHLGKTGNLSDLADYNKVSHFNYGGIADAISNKLESAISRASSESLFDYSGKMYTDQAATAPTTDFAAAKFGDIAYWASKGKYRTPSAAEFKDLYDKASRMKATYMLDGVTVAGTYFFDPAAGTDPVIDTENTKALTAEDLTKGLFLPWSGRAYAANDFLLYAVNTIGVYRTATLNPQSTAEATNGALYRVSYIIEEKESNRQGLNGAFYNKGWGANGRYSIRPVYVE